MSKTPVMPENKATIRIFGDVFASDFPYWIGRHSAKLGLRSLLVARLDEYLEVGAVGPEELLEALALACSLGPASVLVDRIEYEQRKTD